MKNDIHPLGECCAACKNDIERGRNDLLELAQAAERVQQDSAFQKFMAARRDRPLPRTQLKKFGLQVKIEGKAGEKVFHAINVDYFCRGERFIVGSGMSLDGARILNLAGLQLTEEMQQLKIWTYEAQTLGCGMIIGSFSPTRPFTIEIEFLKDCTFEADVLGSAVSQTA